MGSKRTRAAALLAAAALAAPAGGSLHEYPSGAAMRDAARALLGSLEPEPRGGVQGGFENPYRLQFAYTPIARQGLPLLAMDEAQRELTWALVDSGLGERGRLQARQIVQLEEVLFDRTGGAERRDPGRYFLAIFGAPGNLGPWGWRFEGHHLSLSFTLLDGRVVGATPAFFGGNPAHVQAGERIHPGLRPFAQEEKTARALLLALSEEMQRRAIISVRSPGDVLTRNDVPAARPPLMGVRYDELPEPLQEALLALLDLYAARLAPELAERELQEIRDAGLGNLHFAWAGSVEPDAPHYYRIQGPTFVVEYDNTQDDANHVHTVWRNFARDFGADPLRQHIASAHRHGDHTHTH